MSAAQQVRRRARAYWLNRPGTEAQLVFDSGVWHFRSDGHAHWMEASGEATLFARVRAFCLDRRRRELRLRFDDGSELIARKTWLGSRLRATERGGPGSWPA